jgi:hypothetical protein
LHRRLTQGRRPKAAYAPSPTRGEGIFSDRRLSYSISTPYRTIKCRIWARLHIGSKIGTIESKADAGIVDSGKLTRAERIGSARRESNIDLFGYGKSIINLDAKVADRALDLSVA